MTKRKTIKKAIKPSERESITDFSATYGGPNSYEMRMKRRRILTTVGVIAGILALIAVGYFFTELFIDITELPVNG